MMNLCFHLTTASLLSALDRLAEGEPLGFGLFDVRKKAVCKRGCSGSSDGCDRLGWDQGDCGCWPCKGQEGKTALEMAEGQGKAAELLRKCGGRT